MSRLNADDKNNKLNDNQDRKQARALARADDDGFAIVEKSESNPGDKGFGYSDNLWCRAKSTASRFLKRKNHRQNVQNI